MLLNKLIERNGRLSIHIEHVGLRRWHPTITAMRPDSRLVDERIPIVDLGVFRTRKAAKAAANLVAENWTWDSDD
jgi:hypothetical protein